MNESAAPVPPIEFAFPDIGRWAGGNTGIPYVWTFAGAGTGPQVTIQALTHGNEACGAVVLDWLLAQSFRPARGTVTLIFANAAAYQAFDAQDPYAARCLDEDFNRLWDSSVLDAMRQTRELLRARELRPVYDATDHLLDLHSMSDSCPPLALAGRQPKGLELARALGIPEYVVVDGGHVAGRRLRDYAHFDDPADPRSALLVECGQHWERAAPIVACQVTLRFLQHFRMADPEFLGAQLDPATPLRQRTIAVTDSVTIATQEFDFSIPVCGLMVIASRGTLLARDGATEIRTPYDDCVLIMPSRRPRKGETAVRLGRYVG